VAAPRAGGGVTFPVLRSSPPLSLRPVHTWPTASLLEAGHGDRLCLLSSAAGPLGGDDVTLDLTVRSGACLTVVSAAASVALAGPASQWSAMTVRARVEAGASLQWMPEPLVVAAGSQHRSHAVLDLASSAIVTWRDVVVLGRHDGGSGRAWIRMTADLDGTPLLRHELRLGPGTPAWDGPAGIGDARVVASLLWAHPDLEVAAVADPDAGVFPLDGPAALAVALGRDVPTTLARLDDTTLHIIAQR
jgi:urease accessory protein